MRLRTGMGRHPSAIAVPLPGEFPKIRQSQKDIFSQSARSKAVDETVREVLGLMRVLSAP